MRKTTTARTVAAAIVIFLCSVASALDVHTGPIVLGEWNSSFSKGKEYAETYKVPMLLFWANPGCGNCGLAQRNCSDPEFVEWQTRRQIVMVFDEGGSTAKSFARNPSGLYPYMCVYWPREDGTVTKNCFSGLSASFPVQKDADGNALNWVGKMTASVDLYIEGYNASNFKGGEFAVGTSSGNRLEAIEGKTTFVDVLLSRSLVDATEAATAVMTVEYPGGREPNGALPEIEWAVGERHKTVRVEIPGFVKAGDVIKLTLWDDTDKPRGESMIFVVADPGPGVLNPSWYAQDVTVGEWTLNYAAAKDLVAAEAGRTLLVLFDGTLWCPYCKGMESSLLADEAFYDWARSRDVVLMQFDQGRASNPATAAGTLAPRLLTYEPDPNLAASNTVSGAGYRSRNMIDDTSARAAIDLTTRFTREWLAPGSTSARMSQPSMLLVRDDKVIARFASYRNADRVYDTVENIGRLDDFLKLAGRADETSDYRTTTMREHAVGVDESSVDFQISDRNEYFKLKGLAAGRLDLAVTPETAGRDVTISVYDGAQLLASGANALSVKITAEMLTHDLRLGLTAYPNTSVRFFVDEGYETTCFSATLTSAVVLLPEERKAVAAPVGASVNMAVEKDVVYCLEGFTSGSLEAAFTAVAGKPGQYAARATATVTLTKAAGEISYQLWRPGAVGFAVPSISVTESEVTVPIAVVRKGGSSGAVKVRVTVAPSAPGQETRYSWSDVEFEWADGHAEPKTAELKVHDDWACDGDLELVFALQLISGADVEVDAGGCKVKIVENDRRVVGKLAIVGTAPDFARKMTTLVPEGSPLTIRVERLNGAKGEVEATLRSSSDAIADIPLVWEDNDHDAVREAKVVLPTLADCPSGKLTFSLAAAGASVDSQRKTLTVQLTAEDAPQFASPEVTLPLLRYVSFEKTVPVTGLKGGKVTVTKLSGTLPAGLKAAYDSMSQALVLTGVPSRPGDYEAVYQVKEVRSGKTVGGGTVKIGFAIADPAVPGTASGATYAFAGKAKTFSGVPVMDAERARMIGVLTLTLPATGKSSAKYQCAGGTIALSAASWAGADAEGTLSQTLRSRDGAYSVELKAKADGSVAATLWDPSWPGDTIAVRFGAQAWSKAEPADGWKGVYTVACLMSERMSGTEDVTPTGDAVLTLKLNTSSALNNGQANFAGVLPNGKAVSGSAVLVADGRAGTAWLPVYVRSSTEVFSAPLAIMSGVAAEYAKGGDDPRIQRAISPDATANVFFAHIEPKTELGDYEVKYEAYGSWYEADQPFDEALMHTELMPMFDFVVKTGDLLPSAAYGVVGEVAPIPVKVSGSGLSGLALDKASGQVRGTVSIPFTDAEGKVRKVTATYRGVVLPGWTGCGCTDLTDLPFVQGACWFTDKLFYSEDWASCTESVAPEKQVSIRRGCALDCEMKPYGN